MRKQKLTREAREYIYEQMHDSDRLDLETVMDYIRPHFLFEPDTAKEQQIRAVARYLIKQIKDARGLSDCYQFKDEQGKSAYLDITKTIDRIAYNKAQEQVSKQFHTLHEVMKKFTLNSQRIDGQTLLDGFNEDAPE